MASGRRAGNLGESKVQGGSVLCVRRRSVWLYLRVCVCVYVCVPVLGMSVCTHVQSLSQSCELFHAVFGPSAQPTATQS